MSYSNIYPPYQAIIATLYNTLACVLNESKGGAASLCVLQASHQQKDTIFVAFVSTQRRFTAVHTLFMGISLADSALFAEFDEF
jgi:hypothetical protein